MPNSLRRRWATCLATVATLLSTALGAGVIAAPSASASIGTVYDGGDYGGNYWNLQSSSSCYYCLDELAQRFTAAADGPIAKVVLQTPYSPSSSTVEIRTAEAFPSP